MDIKAINNTSSTTKNSFYPKDKKEMAKTAGILFACPALSNVSYLIYENFTSKKDYNESVKNHEKLYEDAIKAQLIKFKAIDENIDLNKERIYLENTLKPTLENQLKELKTTRIVNLKKGIKLATGIGFAIAPFTLIIRNYINKKREGKKPINKTEVAKSAAIIAASPFVGIGSFLAIDAFTGKKSYQNKLDNAYKTVKIEVKNSVRKDIQKQKSYGETISYDDLRIMLKLTKQSKTIDYNHAIKKLEENRKIQLKNGKKISAIIGLALSPFVIAGRYFYNKKNQNKFIQQIFLSSP